MYTQKHWLCVYCLKLEARILILIFILASRKQTSFLGFCKWCLWSSRLVLKFFKVFFIDANGWCWFWIISYFFFLLLYFLFDYFLRCSSILYLVQLDKIILKYNCWHFFLPSARPILSTPEHYPSSKTLLNYVLYISTKAKKIINNIKF